MDNSLRNTNYQHSIKEKITSEVLSLLNSLTYKMIPCESEVGKDFLWFIPTTQGWLDTWKSTSIIHNINRIIKKRFSINAENISQSPTSISDRNSQQTSNRRTLPHTDKDSYKKPAANIVFNGERLNAFLSSWYQEQGDLLFLLVSIKLKSQASAIGHEKGFKIHPNWRERTHNLFIYREDDCICRKSWSFYLKVPRTNKWI